jgi:hypothetical protein
MSSAELRKLINIVEGYDEAYDNYMREMSLLRSSGFDQRGRGAGNDKPGEVGYWFSKDARDTSTSVGRYYYGHIMFKHNNYTRINDQVRAKIGYEDYAFTPNARGQRTVAEEQFENIDAAIEWVNAQLAKYAENKKPKSLNDLPAHQRIAAMDRLRDKQNAKK